MPSTFNPNATYSGTGSTSSTTPTTLPGTSASTATTGATTAPAALNAQQVAQFMSANDISSTDQAAYINGGQLTDLGQTLQWYGSLDQTDRQQVQTTLVALGYLPDSDATGEANNTTLSALKTVLTTGNLSSFQTALSDPTTATRAQIATNLAAASKEASAAATTPVVASITDTNAANETLSKAFQDALGYSPSAEQMNTFTQSLHAAQENEASGTKDAEQQAASGEEAQAKAEEGALQKLGPDGLDAFLTAYQNAIHGIAPTAGNTNAPQGPQVGTQNASLPAGTVGPMGGAAPPTTTQVPNTASGTQAILHNLNPMNFTGISALSGGSVEQAGQQTSGTHPATSPAVNTPPDLSVAPQGLGTTPSYGGIFAVSPAIWKQAQQALGTSSTLGKQAAAATTAGAASKTVQAAAIGALAQELHDTNGGSWSDVAITLAGGNPKTPSSGHVLNTSTNIQNFATGIANNVNSQIEAIQNQVPTQAPVIAKESPNPEADALASAESADPNQYVAHNFSLAEGTVQKMLYGTPQIEAQSDSNLAGDVAQVTASNSAAT